MTATINLVDIADSLQQADENTLLCYLEDLEAHFKKREPNVLAFVPQEERFERLRNEARALLAQYPYPDTRPPLFGVPVGVKDVFHVNGFVTHAGSKLPSDELHGQEADSVSRLKAAGALIIGKTVTTEFAYLAYGPTLNPHNPRHTPGGSSSGSAAAVGTGMCPLALGTQTIGSITRPAAFCGTVGYKPTYERVSRSGVIPLSPSVDHVGHFASDVAGAGLAAGVLLENWNLIHSDEPRPLPRLGIPEGPYLQHTSGEGMENFRTVCNRLADAGFDIQSVPVMPDFDDIHARHDLIVAAEAARVHSEWFANYGGMYRAKTVELIKRGAVISNADLEKALRGRDDLRNELAALMDANRIDLWVSPSATGAAPEGISSTGDPVMNLPWTHCGMPTLGLPSGISKNMLPLGVQLAARFYADEELFAWAAPIEQALQKQCLSV